MHSGRDWEGETWRKRGMKSWHEILGLRFLTFGIVIAPRSLQRRGFLKAFQLFAHTGDPYGVFGVAGRFQSRSLASTWAAL